MRIYWLFIWRNLNSLHPKMLCAKIVWNWLSGSGEEDFFYFVFDVFLLFRNYLPLEKGGALHLKNSLHPRMLCAISLLSPLGKGLGPSFEETWIPFTQGCFVPSLVEIGPVVLEKKMKMWKVYDNANNNDRRTTDKAHLSLWLRSAKN